MDSIRRSEDRSWLAWGLAASVLACIWLVAAAPAMAVPAQGSAEIRLAQHAKGRTLSGQGVSVVAGAPAQKQGSSLSLPISAVESNPAAATTDAWLRFKRGKRSVVLSALRFDLAAGTLNGKLGGEEVAAFLLGASARIDAASGRVSLSDGNLRLTAGAATALKQRLGLGRALVRKGVGVIWLSAQTKVDDKPLPAVPDKDPEPTRVSRPVVSGAADWGVLASWRSYVLGFQGPGSTGTITTADGASANGNLSEAGGYFGFPMVGENTFEQGLHGATDRLVLLTQGSVAFAKPAHCIVEVKLADLVVTLDGADSSIVLDSDYDIDSPPGCGPQPAVSTDDVTFASLDPSGVTPVYSDGGKTVTWNAIPAMLTADGSAAFGLGSQYQEGHALDPVTVTVGLE